MQVMTIAEVLQLGAGEQIQGVKGLVKSVFERKGVGKKGGTLQSIVLVDSGKDIYIKFWDRPALSEHQWRGKVMTILAHDGENGPEGVEVGEYKGDLNVSVHKIAEVLDVRDPRDEGKMPAGDKAAAGTKAPARQEQQTDTTKTPRPTRAEQEAKALGGCRLEAARLANVMTLGYAAIIKMTVPAVNELGVEMSDEAIQKCAVSLAIDLKKSGWHLNMPVTPIKLHTTKTEPAPSAAKKEGRR